MDWYQTADDSLRITRRVITKSVAGVINNRHVFYGQENDETETRLSDAEVELQHVVVLALVAAFERLLRDHIGDVIRGEFFPGNDVKEAIGTALLEDAEFWKFGDRLVDVFVVVPALDRGNIKQLIKFRNWVAHGHGMKSPAPMNAIPTMAYQRLTAFLTAIGIVP